MPMPRDRTRRRPRFQDLQYRFAAHLRDPERNPPPEGIEDRRLRIYRDLVYNNVEGFLANAFPVLRRLYESRHWHGLVRGFFVRHVSHSPQFYQIAEEFLRYLEDEHEDRPEDPPFLRELAHYEWVELILALKDIDLEQIEADTHGDLLAGAPVLSPLAWPLAYRYPVHEIREDFQPQKADEAPTLLVVYRDRKDKVGFLKVNAATARLIERLEAEPETSGHEHLQALAAEMRHPDPAAVVEHGRVILEDLRRHDIVLGIRPASSP